MNIIKPKYFLYQFYYSVIVLQKQINNQGNELFLYNTFLKIGSALSWIMYIWLNYTVNV